MTGTTRSWDESSFFEALRQIRSGAEAAEVAGRLLEWGRRDGRRVAWGTGRTTGSVTPVLRGPSGTEHYPFTVFSYGKVEIQFQHLKPKAPFDDEGVRRQLLAVLNRVPGVQFQADAIDRRPSIPLVDLKADVPWSAFQEVLTWFTNKVGSA